MEELQTFGQYLRDERERRQMPLDDVSISTRIPVHILENLEAGRWTNLPAEVFVRGFVRSYARQVGFSPEDAVGKLRDSLDMIREKQRRQEIEEETQRQIALQQYSEQTTSSWFSEHRRLNLALFVIILLIIATITFSLIWRRGSSADNHASLLPQKSTVIDEPYQPGSPG